ncbi:MAG: hypothetical protein HYX27_27285 [Acidobacteria bacterium]|nr:hypothetical protein [Acidobacteriota bacterium]
MTAAEFQRLLNTGRGKAVQYALAHDVSDFRDIILDMCLHNRAHDLTFDGTRAAYFYNFLNLLPDREFYFDRILEGLAEVHDNGDGWHRFTLAGCLAQDGNKRARELLYQHYRPGPEFGECLGISFVDLDGIPGFLFAAEKIGELLTDPSLDVKAGWLFARACNECGDEEVRNALNAVAQSNRHLEAYRAVAEKESAPSTQMRPPEDFSALLDQLGSYSRSQLRHWGDRADSQSLREAAEAFERTRNPSLLPIFWNAKYPLDTAPIVEVVGTDHERAAIQALARAMPPESAAIARRLWHAQSPNRDFGIELLGNDLGTALSWFLAESDLEIMHRQGVGLRNLVEKHRDHELAVQALLQIFAFTPCSECRWFAAADLLERNALPPAILAECAYDSHSRTREIAGYNSGC